MRQTLYPGDVVDGRFEVRNHWPGLPFVELYICYDREAKEMVELKGIRDEYMSSAAAEERFLKFAEKWIGLGSHKNIVQAKSVVYVKGKPFICVDCDAPFLSSLYDFLVPRIEYQKVPVRKGLRLALDICSGMEWVTRNRSDSVFYGNLAPADVAITEDEVAKVTDFGLMRLLRELGVTLKRFTFVVRKHYNIGWRPHFFGRPDFMSPEHWREDPNMDVRSDIYSFGCILYYLLTRYPPFCCSTITECRKSHLSLKPKDPKEVEPDIPEDLAKVVMRCLEKRPEDRYDSFRTLKKDLVEVYERLTGNSLIEETEEVVTAWKMATKASSLARYDKHEEAEEWCEKALRISPQNPLAWEVKSKLREWSGDMEGALECIDRALDVNVRLGPLLRRKAKILSELGDPKGALQCLERALAEDPDDLDYVVSAIDKGACYIDLGEYEKAIKWFDYVLENCEMEGGGVNTVQEYMGDAYAGMGKTEEAIKCYDYLLDSEPSEDRVILKKAKVLAKAGRYMEALEYYTMVTEHSERNVDAWLGKAEMSIHLNKTKDAIEAFQKALESDREIAKQWVEEAQAPLESQNLLVLKTRGAALLKAGMAPEASVCIDKALDIDPRDFELWKLKATVYSQRDMERAIECLDKAIEINPRDEEAWELKGKVYEDAQRAREAIECYDRVLEINPNNANAWFSKGYMVDIFLSNSDLAISCYNRYLELCPDDNEVWFLKGQAHRFREEYEEALACFDKALEIMPDDDEALDAEIHTCAEYSERLCDQGMEFLAEGNYERALELFDKAVKLDPKNKEARNGRRRAQKKLSELNEAIEWFNKALELDPSDQKVWNAKGEVLLELRKSQDALECFMRAIQINPEFTVAWINKGLVHAKRTEFEEAFSCFDRAVQIDPKNAGAWYYRGAALGNLRKFEQALDSYEKAVKLSPRYADAWYNMALCLTALMRFGEAATAFRKFLRLARRKKHSAKIEHALRMLVQMELWGNDKNGDGEGKKNSP